MNHEVGVFNPNTDKNCWLQLKSVPFYMQTGANNKEVLLLKGRGLRVRVPPQTYVTFSDFKVLSTVGGAHCGSKLSFCTKYFQLKATNPAALTERETGLSHFSELASSSCANCPWCHDNVVKTRQTHAAAV